MSAMGRAASSREILGALATVLLQLRGLLAGVLIFGTLATAWWFVSGETSLLIATKQIAAMLTVGLALPFYLHESAHALVALGAAEVTAVRIESTLLRISIRPEGTLTYGRALACAIAGPGVCLLVTFPLTAVGQPLAAIAFGIHAVFLIPPFGDGRVVVLALSRLMRPGGFGA